MTIETHREGLNFKTGILVIFVCLSSRALAGEGLQLAEFVSPNPLEQNIQFPQHDSEIELTILCEAYARRSGYLGRINCYRDPTNKIHEKFIAEIYKAHLKHLPTDLPQTKPALRNGKKISLNLQFSVEFVKNSNSEKVTIYQNHGYDTNVYGRGYLGAQRIPNYRNVGFGQCNMRFTTWVTTSVDERGRPSEVEPISKVSRVRCQRQLNKTLRGSKFIPASLDGSPIKTKYTELFFGSPSTAMWKLN